MIKPELEFVYEAGGELEPPREIGKVVDGTRRIIPISAGGYVKGPRISGKLMGNSADWQLTRPDGVTVADAIYAIETDDGATIMFEWHGYGRAYPPGRRQIVGAVFHLSDAEQYRRLNDAVCVCVGEVRAPADPDQLEPDLVVDVAELIWQPIAD